MGMNLSRVSGWGKAVVLSFGMEARHMCLSWTKRFPSQINCQACTLVEGGGLDNEGQTPQEAASG